jgi:hypothetical protein
MPTLTIIYLALRKPKRCFANATVWQKGTKSLTGLERANVEPDLGISRTLVGDCVLRARAYMTQLDHETSYIRCGTCTRSTSRSWHIRGRESCHANPFTTYSTDVQFTRDRIVIPVTDDTLLKIPMVPYDPTDQALTALIPYVRTENEEHGSLDREVSTNISERPLP